MSFDGYGNSHDLLKLGPWGGQNGEPWEDEVCDTVRQVEIRHGASGIDSIQFEYDKKGSSVLSKKHGGTGCKKTDKTVLSTVKLDYPDEYLVSISGHYDRLKESGPVLIRSLMFQSNKKNHGPFGSQNGTKFSSPMTGGKIVGFHGRSSCYLHSIGVHIGVSKPWVGVEGEPWNDGVFSGVKRILLFKGKAIYTIQIEYDRNDESVWSGRHGGGTEGSTEMIKFDYPEEVLTRVSGHYDGGVIKSLTFYTNYEEKTYGPYGEETGTPFTFPKTGGKIVGFHGWSNLNLHAIGVLSQQWSNDLGQQGLGERGGPV